MSAREDEVWQLFAEGKIDRDGLTALLALAHMAAAAEAHAVDQFEQQLANVPDARSVPLPNDCHPAYTDRRDMIVHWLDNPRGNYSDNHLRLPVLRRSAFMIGADETYPTSAAILPIETLTRRRCAGFAPYVGEPFHYEWEVAEDTHGRWVAADARPVRHAGR